MWKGKVAYYSVGFSPERYATSPSDLPHLLLPLPYILRSWPCESWSMGITYWLILVCKLLCQRVFAGKWYIHILNNLFFRAYGGTSLNGRFSFHNIHWALLQSSGFDCSKTDWNLSFFPPGIGARMGIIIQERRLRGRAHGRYVDGPNFNAWHFQFKGFQVIGLGKDLWELVWVRGDHTRLDWTLTLHKSSFIHLVGESTSQWDSTQDWWTEKAHVP